MNSRVAFQTPPFIFAAILRIGPGLLEAVSGALAAGHIAPVGVETACVAGGFSVSGDRGQR